MGIFSHAVSFVAGAVVLAAVEVACPETTQKTLNKAWEAKSNLQAKIEAKRAKKAEAEKKADKAPEAKVHEAPEPIKAKTFEPKSMPKVTEVVVENGTK